MDDPIFPQRIKFLPPQNTVDPKQLQQELQRAFDDVNAMIIMQFDLQIMTLGTLVDLDLVEIKPLIGVFQKIKNKQTNTKAKAAMSDFIDSFRLNYDGAETSEAHLRLVSALKPENDS